MDSCYRFLTLGIPWTQSMPSRDVNAATRLAEASWRRDKLHNSQVYYAKACIVVVYVVGDAVLQAHLK